MYQEDVGMGESIYELIPRPVEPPLKNARYKSKFPGAIPPTFSTFGTTGTSKPNCTNISGHYLTPKEGEHQYKKSHATMGTTGNSNNPSQMLRKHEKEPVLPAPSKFEYTGDKKLGVPKKEEKPMMGVRSNKNFITANAVENILAQPKKAVKDTDWTKKPTYGKTPSYLKKVKKEISEEYNYIRAVQEQQQDAGPPGMRLLSEDERLTLIDQLKAKWDNINQEYQRSSTLALFNLDTIGKVKRKEQYEAQLAQIEKDIEKLSKKFIWVKDDEDFGGYY